MSWQLGNQLIKKLLALPDTFKSDDLLKDLYLVETTGRLTVALLNAEIKALGLVLAKCINYLLLFFYNFFMKTTQIKHNQPPLSIPH